VRDDPLSTAPRFAVYHVGLVRSHPQEVSRLSAPGKGCTPLFPVTEKPALLPASCTGCAIPRPHGWATPGADALHCPRARIRLPTFRTLHSRGEDPSVHRGIPCVRQVAVQTSRACSPSPCGSGAVWPLSLRACHDASPRGVTSVLHTRHFPQSVQRAARFSSVSEALETPPFPVTPPQRGDRGHNLMTESSRPIDVQ